MGKPLAKPTWAYYLARSPDGGHYLLRVPAGTKVTCWDGPGPHNSCRLKHPGRIKALQDLYGLTPLADLPASIVNRARLGKVKEVKADEV